MEENLPSGAIDLRLDSGHRSQFAVLSYAPIELGFSAISVFSICTV
jgi:hypothetical protein